MLQNHSPAYPRRQARKDLLQFRRIRGIRENQIEEFLRRRLGAAPRHDLNRRAQRVGGASNEFCRAPVPLHTDHIRSARSGLQSQDAASAKGVQDPQPVKGLPKDAEQRFSHPRGGGSSPLRDRVG